MKIADYAVKKRSSYSVDLAGGDLQLKPKPDLVTGVGDFPYSLSYQRVYSAGGIDITSTVSAAGVSIPEPTEQDPATIGGGWSHALALKAQFESDAFAGMGRDSGLSASSVIAGMYVQRTLQLGTVDMRSRLATMFTANWLVNSLNRNVIVVSRPPARSTFVRLPDNSFDSGPGSAEILTQSGNQTFYGWYNAWMWNTVPVTLSLTGKDGSVITFLESIGTETETQFSMPFNFPLVPQTWTFPSGVVVAFSYSTASNDTYWPLYGSCLIGVSNNLGRTLTFNDPCAAEGLSSNAPGGAQWVKDDSGRKVSFSSVSPGEPTPGLNWATQILPSSFLVTAPDGGVTEYDYTYTSSTANNRPFAGIYRWFTPNDRINPYVTATYDSLFRVSALTDNSSPTKFITQYYVSGLFGTQNQKRSDVADPLSAVTTTYYDQWNHDIQTVDPLGRATSFTYDSNRRLAKTIYPELNTDTYTYDVRSNRLTLTHNPKPGSSLAPEVTTTSFMEGPAVTTCVHTATCNKPLTVDGPRTDVSDITTYSYNGDGTLARAVGPSVSWLSSGGTTGTNGAQSDYCYTPLAGTTGSISLLSGRIDRVGAANRVETYTYNTLANHLVLLNAVKDPLSLPRPACHSRRRMFGYA